MNWLKLLKYLVVFFNVLCGVFAISSAIINVTGLALTGSEDKPQIITSIILCSIIFIATFVGCFGAITENLCCLWTYAIFLILLIVAELVLLIIYMKGVDCEKSSKRDADAAWEEYLNSNFIAMNLIQKSLNCCGRYGPLDYETAGLKIPISCYKKEHVSPEDLYGNGCVETLKKSCHKYLPLRLTCVWGKFAVEVIAFACAITLAILFRYEGSRYSLENN